MSSWPRRQVQQIGGYLDADTDGFIVKPASTATIQPAWRRAIDDSAEACAEHFGDALDSVYVRGSVARGEAVDNISDLDLVVILRTRDADQRPGSTCSRLLSRRMAPRYPFITKYETIVETAATLMSSRRLRIIMKTQTVCVYGADIAESMAPIKIGPEAAYYYVQIRSQIEGCLWNLSRYSPSKTAEKCTWIAKRILRAGFELVMQREGRFTRDLYPCYDSFATHYPERRKEMYRILELAIDPISDSDTLLRVLLGCYEWLTHEVDVVFGGGTSVSQPVKAHTEPSE